MPSCVSGFFLCCLSIDKLRIFNSELEEKVKVALDLTAEITEKKGRR
jgi:hypothetical protein